ncbi:MAG: tryptophan-rich sensory protein [Ardenticatenia bacterium]|uniref:Tryptophan-rich sensory protein n=1 Tax=Ardenticatena maritima TaxID=872965 RepID=A0A0M8K6J2_9CHLR|nr:TspO/MBR family protein [Ardenticatena maritima]KPL86380.1 hypothetical protein SE16_13765 [Ardenticatena maritima]RME13845.1 MAG: tryptophan-rich sensory protein [Ardenticatenia bacterium]GAP62823.1 tryptophan-rich sensory protein [Ardenticatena maritima]
MSIQRLGSLVLALLAPFTAAALGGFATARNVKTWYPTLRKPRWNPPAWLFGPVWTLLYTAMGIASWLVWQKRPNAPETKTALTVYGAQLGLNALWSVLFFGLRRPAWAFAEIVALWLAIVETIRRFWAIDSRAGALLLPYLAWSSFAAILNATIWRLNRTRST